MSAGGCGRWVGAGLSSAASLTGFGASSTGCRWPAASHTGGGTGACSAGRLIRGGADPGLAAPGRGAPGALGVPG
eukprot:9063389-Prorocentrum_lima.AAC.1